jgi:salicylate hydroxylase
VQKASYVTADVLHLPDGPEATERNRHLSSPDWMHGQLDWIHSYNADPNFEKVTLA